MTYNPADADIEEIAAELAQEFCGKSLADLRREVREQSGNRVACRQLHDLFAKAAAERYKRMGLDVKPGNAAGARMREPGDGTEEE